MKNTMESAGNGISVVGTMTWVVSYLKSIDWLTLVGVLVALAGLLINFYFSSQRNKREAEESRLKAEAHAAQVELTRRDLEKKALEIEDLKKRVYGDKMPDSLMKVDMPPRFIEEEKSDADSE